jgi:hypothetical protein
MDDPPARKAADPLDGAPGPSPWYLRGARRPAPGYSWKDAGKSRDAAGIVALAARGGPVLLLDFYNYATLLGPDLLLVWGQESPNARPTGPVSLDVFRLSTLERLPGSIDEECRNMRREGARLRYRTPPEARGSIPTAPAAEGAVERPSELRAAEEFLILCRSSLAASGDAEQPWNLALLVLNPREARYALHLQDWFNAGAYDYAYEWVTRVARDPRTGFVHGDGIRIGAFVLDDSLRQLRTR